MKVEDTLEKAGSLVPEIYYDLIARIAPGCLTLFGVIYIAHDGRLISAKVDVSSWLNMGIGTATLLLVLIVGMGYLTGILLTPFGRHAVGNMRWVRCLFMKIPRLERGKRIKTISKAIRDEYTDAIPKSSAEELRDVLKALHDKEDLGAIECEEIRKMIDSYNCSFLYALDHLLYEKARISAEHAGIIAKMRAEMAACRNLTAAMYGLFLFALFLSLSRMVQFARAHASVDFFAPFRDLLHESHAPVTAIFFALTCVAALAAFYRENAYWTRLLSFVQLAHEQKMEDRVDQRPGSNNLIL